MDEEEVLAQVFYSNKKYPHDTNYNGSLADERPYFSRLPHYKWLVPSISQVKQRP